MTHAIRITKQQAEIIATESHALTIATLSREIASERFNLAVSLTLAGANIAQWGRVLGMAPDPEGGDGFVLSVESGPPREAGALRVAPGTTLAVTPGTTFFLGPQPDGVQ